MAKFKVCVIKTIKVFDHIEVDAKNDMQAVSMAISFAKRADSTEFCPSGDVIRMGWEVDDRPVYRGEVV